jgi:hypothetical protein
MWKADRLATGQSLEGETLRGGLNTFTRGAQKAAKATSTGRSPDLEIVLNYEL